MYVCMHVCMYVGVWVCVCMYVCMCHGILMSMHRALQITSEKLAILDCNRFIKSTMN